MIKMKHTMTSMKMVVAIASMAALSACTGGDGSISIGSTSSSSSSEPGSITVTKFQSVVEANWQIENSTDAIETKSGAITFGGTCTRGVNKIVVKSKLHAAGSYTDTGVTADCLNQVFSWTGPTISSDNYYDYQLYGVNGSGIEQTDKAVIKKIKLDTTAPVAPSAFFIDGSTAINANDTLVLTSGTEYNNRLRVVVSGTISSDTKTMVATTGCMVGHFNLTDYTGVGHFTYTIDLARSSSCEIAFVAYDDLSNASGDFTITLGYTPPLAGSGDLDTFYMNYNAGASILSGTSGAYTMTRASMPSFSGGGLVGATDFRAGVASYLGQIQ